MANQNRISPISKRRASHAVLCSALLACTALIGCGPKNPLKGYKNLPQTQWEPQYTPQTIKKAKPKTYTTPEQIVFINESGNETFVQGVTNHLNIDVRFADPQFANARYQLVLADGQAKQLGAHLVSPNSAHGWQLAWTPAKNTLTTDQTNAKFPITIQFILDNNNSQALKSLLAGQTIQSSFNIYLNKSAAKPAIQVANNFKINWNQTLTIPFVVSAKGFVNPSDISVNVINGPSVVSNELPQLGGIVAVTSWPNRTKTLGVDKLGRTQFQYEMQLSGPQFSYAIYKALKSNWRWATKLNDGKIKTVEALFYLQAQNGYNGARSDSYQVIVNINLDAQAGTPVVIGGAHDVRMKAGETNVASFLVGTSGGRGDLFIDSAQIVSAGAKDKSVSVPVRLGRAKLSSGGINVGLNCQSAGVNLNQRMSCRTGQCVQTCVAQVVADCSQNPVTQYLTLDTRSVLGASIKSATLTVPIVVTNRSNLCVAQNGANSSKSIKGSRK